MSEGEIFKVGLPVLQFSTAMRDIDRCPSLFAFHLGDHGMRVELVDAVMRSEFEGWFAGGELERG